MSDSAGVQIVAASGTDAPSPWASEPLCRVGGTDTGPEAFARVDQSTVTTDGDDRIFVLRPDVRSVEVFDVECRHLATLGRVGDGPGEMRTPTAIAVMPDGELHVFDAAKQARLRWAHDFTLLPPIPWDGATSLPNGPLRLEANRAVFLSARGGGGTMTHLLTVLHGQTRVDLDSLVNPFPSPAMTSCGMQMLDPVFAPQPIWAMQDGRIAFARSDRYELRVYLGDRLARVVRRPLRGADASAEDARRARPEGERIGPCVLPVEEFVSEVGVAPSRPVLQSIALDAEHQLWVERWGFPDEPPVTDLYAADGRYLGTFSNLAAPLGSLRDGRIVVPVRDPATDLVQLVILRGVAPERRW